MGNIIVINDINDIYNLEEPEVMLTRKEHSVSGIYAIINIVNKRIYIGSTINLYKRKNEHFSALKSCKHHNSFLQNDFNKCGEKSFVFKILFFAQKKDIKILESKTIEKYYDEQNLCYNLTKNTKSPNLGKRFTDVHRIRLSLSHKGKTLSTECKNKISSSLTGRKKTKKYIKNNLLGNKNPRSRSVNKYSCDGKYMCTYNTISEAAKDNNIFHSTISQTCSGKVKSAGGFIWRYKDDLPPNANISSVIIKNSKRKVVKKTKKNEVITIYSSSSCASRINNIARSNIIACCRGRRKSAGGFIWEYFDE